MEETTKVPGLEEVLMGPQIPTEKEDVKEPFQAVAVPIITKYTYLGALNREMPDKSIHPTSVFLFADKGPLVHGQEAKIFVIDGETQEVSFLPEMEDMSLKNINAALWGKWAGEQLSLEQKFYPIEETAKQPPPHKCTSEIDLLTEAVETGLPPLVRELEITGSHFCNESNCKPCTELYLQTLEFIGSLLPTIPSPSEEFMAFIIEKDIIPRETPWFSLPLEVYTKAFITEFVTIPRNTSLNPKKGGGASTSEKIKTPTLTHKGCIISDCQTCMQEHLILGKYFQQEVGKDGLEYMYLYEQYMKNIGKEVITKYGWGTEYAFDIFYTNKFIKFLQKEEYTIDIEGVLQFKENRIPDLPPELSEDPRLTYMSQDDEMSEDLLEERVEAAEVETEEYDIDIEEDDASGFNNLICLSPTHTLRCAREISCTTCINEDAEFHNQIIRMVNHYINQNRYDIDNAYEYNNNHIAFEIFVNWFETTKEQSFLLSISGHIRAGAYLPNVLTEFKTMLENGNEIRNYM